MARPSKEAHEQRKVVSIRLTEAELGYARSQAEAAGLSLSAYVRERVLGYRGIANGRHADPALVHEINRIGVNVNQLARSVHRGSDFTQFWAEIGEDLKTVMAKVLTRHGA